MLVKIKRVWLICLMAGVSLSTACSSTPEKTPDCNIPAPMAEVQRPLSVPEMPVETSRFEGGATFDRDGIVQLTQVRAAAATNQKIGEENALALEARNAEVNELIECSRYMKVWIDVHAEDLKDEKREHMIDNVKHWLIIGLGIALGATQ